MRKTLHDYVIERYDVANEEASMPLYYIGKYAELTNRAPRLGDFVPCDEDGNVLEKPNPLSYYSDVCGYQHGQNKIAQYQKAQSRVIFKGDWEVDETGFDTKEENDLMGYSFTSVSNDKYLVEFQSTGEIECWENDGQGWNIEHKVNRIEDLPREIEFKEGLI